MIEPRNLEPDSSESPDDGGKNQPEQTPIHFFLDFPALRYAIAAACFGDLPCLISVRMLLWMVFFDEPFFSGMTRE